MRSVLIVCPSFWPDVSPRSFRWTSIARAWVASGWRVEVVSAYVPGHARRLTRDGVVIRQVGGWLTEDLRRRYAPTEQTPRSGSARPPTSTSGRTPKLLLDVYRLWRSAYWPDSRAPWIPPAMATVAGMLLSSRYDAFVTVSHPFSGHVIGLAAKQLRPSLPWVADVGDPFSLLVDVEANADRFYGSLNRKAERLVLETSNAFSVTTESTKRLYAQNFGGVADKIEVIPPLFTEAGAFRTAVSGTRRARRGMVFVGTLYKELRSPAGALALFDAICRDRAFDDVDLHLVGRLNDCEAAVTSHAEFGRRIFAHGLLDHAAAQDFMRSAWVLLNIANSSGYQLPSKLVEYAATGLPVLNLGSAPADESAMFLARYSSSLSLGTVPDEGECRAALAFLATARAAAPAAVETFMAPYGAAAIAGRYAQLLDSVCSGRA